MIKLLHLDSSGRGELSVSKPLTAYFAKKWKEANPSGQVIYRDLMESRPPFVNAEIAIAINTPDDKLTPKQKDLLVLSDAFISELREADIYVFGVPMYNFGVPAIFKAYIDLAVRAGKTFRYESGKPKGLLANKKLVVINASGGDYSAEPAKKLDFVEPYMRAIMNFVGITDITFIKAPGHNPEMIAASSKAAKDTIDALFQPVAMRSAF
jgi:FMN-dependent NADH-azoreductase